MINRCPDCGEFHTQPNNVDPRYLRFLDDPDPDKRATKIGTLRYLAKMMDTLEQNKVVKNKAIFLDTPNFTVEYTIEKVKEDMLMIQVDRKQFYATSFMRLTMEFYNEMERLKKIGTNVKTNLAVVLEEVKELQEKKSVDAVVK